MRRCGCVTGVIACVFPGVLPGNAGLSRSSTHASASSGMSAPPLTRLASSGRRLKNGRRMMYAVASESMGRTRRVPSPGPVCDSAVQPCHGRKIEHWFLPT